MEELIAYILQFGSLNQQQIDFIKSKAAKSELHTAKCSKKDYMKSKPYK